MSEHAIKWSTLYGTMFHFMGTQLKTAYGEPGEKALRKAIHDYGHYRALERRKTHDRHQLPINLNTMMNYGDMPGDSLTPGEGRVSEAGYHESHVDNCTLFRTWRELGLYIGRIYCEEVHHPMYQDYAPGIALQMPKYLTKYDDECHFILDMDNPNPEMYADFDSLPRLTIEEAMARLQGIFYNYLANAMLKFEDGEQELHKSIRRFGEYRGRQLRKTMADSPRAELMQQLIGHGDVDYGNALVYTTEKTGQDEVTFNISKCMFCKGFLEMEGRKAPIGKTYCQEFHSSFADAVLPAVKTTIQSSIADGEDACVVHFKL